MKNDNKHLDLDSAAINEIQKWLQYAVNRREFMRGGAIAVGLALGILKGQSETTNKEVFYNNGSTKLKNKKVPLVTFGRTGVQVPILGLGSQTMGENQDKFDAGIVEKTALDVYGYAIDNGITYLDSAGGYGRAEEFIGKTIKNRKREDLFITTKVWTDSYEQAKISFERSLSRMGTDHVDLLFIHDAGKRNIENVLKKPGEIGYNASEHGAWAYLEEMKNQGKAKFLGITGHNGREQLKNLVEHTHDASNRREKADAIMIRMSYVSHSWDNFHNVMPELVKKYNLGAMIMKVFGGPNGFGKKLNANELQQAVRYVRGYDWAHGCVIGGSSRKQLDQNIDWVNQTPMSPKEMEELRSLVSASNFIWEKRFAQYVDAKYRFFA